MKLPDFELVRPTSLDDAVDAMGSYGDEAAVLAGGQSLLLEMRYGERTPGVLVGLDRVPRLDTLRVESDALLVGPRVRHAHVADPPESSGALGRLMARMAPYVAHPPVRSRGTFAGSLAWGHPCAEWCALAGLTDAEMTLRDGAGTRTVTASAWFRGDRRTARRPDEVLVEVALPLLPADAGVGFVEHRRSHASFAMVAALAALTLDDGGLVADARLAVAGAADVPLRAVEAEQVLVGRSPDPTALRAAAVAAAQESDPVDEPLCSADYRRHAVEVVSRRTLEAALADVPAGRRS